MLESEQEDKAKISVPCDGIVATRSTDDAEKLDVPLEDIEGDMAMYDIGTVTLGHYIDVIKQSKTIVWNGPMGMYEVEGFSNGTKNIAEAVKEATAAGAVSIVGGGDTLDFHERYGYSLDAYTFVSTAGGAMLDFISGKELPALEALCA
jgi:phosphoglycerate kinase